MLVSYSFILVHEKYKPRASFCNNRKRHNDSSNRISNTYLGVSEDLFTLNHLAGDNLAMSMAGINDKKINEEHYIDGKFKDLMTQVNKLKDNPNITPINPIDEAKLTQEDYEVKFNLLETSLKKYVEEKMQEVTLKIQTSAYEKIIQSDHKIKQHLNAQRKEIKELFNTNKELKKRIDVLEEWKATDKKVVNEDSIAELKDSIKRLKEMYEEQWKEQEKILEGKLQILHKKVEEVNKFKEKSDSKKVIKDMKEKYKELVEDVNKIKINQEKMNKDSTKLGELNKISKQISQYEEFCNNIKKEVAQLKNPTDTENSIKVNNVTKSDIEDLSKKIKSNSAKVKKLEAYLNNNEQIDIKLQSIESNLNNSLITVSSLKEDVKGLKNEAIELKYKAKEHELKFNNTNTTRKLKELKDKLLDIEEQFINYKSTTNNELIKLSQANNLKSNKNEDNKTLVLDPDNKAIVSTKHEHKSNKKEVSCSKSLKYAEQLRLDLSVLNK